MVKTIDVDNNPLEKYREKKHKNKSRFQGNCRTG